MPMRAFLLSFTLPTSPASAFKPIIGRTEVVDGDALAIAGAKARIRRYGMDAPASKQICDHAVGSLEVVAILVDALAGWISLELDAE